MKLGSLRQLLLAKTCMLSMLSNGLTENPAIFQDGNMRHSPSLVQQAEFWTRTYRFNFIPCSFSEGLSEITMLAVRAAPLI